MPCDPIKVPMPDGSVAKGFMCSRGPRKVTRCKCGRPSTLLCDQPLTGPKTGKTCDRPLCERCATEVGPDRHLCPAHAKLGQSPREVRS